MPHTRADGDFPTCSLLHPHVFPSQVNDTRVILQDADPNVVGADYINANYVKVSPNVSGLADIRYDIKGDKEERPLVLL